jgi:hypothetical protein
LNRALLPTIVMCVGKREFWKIWGLYRVETISVIKTRDFG